MKHVLVVMVLILISTSAQAADTPCPGPKGRACLTVAQLSAAVIALARFKQDQPRADEHNVFVSVSETDQEFKVAFLPKPNPSVVGHDGATDYITMDNPKGNQYGKFVEYRISKKLNQVVGTTYAR